MDGEDDAFYTWLVAKAGRHGAPAESEREKALPLRARALGAAAWLAGAESNEKGAPQPRVPSAHELFTILRDTWAAGYRAGRLGVGVYG
jgi:hypothetical protein